MNLRELELLGEPHLRIAGLHLWIHGRQFPDATDYWDGNWLRVTAYYVSPNAMVRAQGAIVHLSELASFLRACERLHESLEGEAALECMEPNLSVTLIAQWNGAITTRVAITPDQLSERHEFEETLDQSYLPTIISGSRAILAAYPLQATNELPPADLIG